MDKKLGGCSYNPFKVHKDTQLKLLVLNVSHSNNARWGASNIPFLRWLPAEYEDDISSPKGWTHDQRLNNHILPLVNT